MTTSRYCVVAAPETRPRLSDVAEPVTVPSAETGAGSALPIAKVLGQPYHELPQDLFIPPDALEVF
ncbi:MAG: segregation/condensation protein A, partial [Aeromonas veronii]